MRNKRPQGRTYWLPRLAVICCGLIEIALMGSNVVYAEETCDRSVLGAKPILPDEVNWATNLEVFEMQLICDLPLGTAKEDVGAYLSQRGIRNNFAVPDGTETGNAFYGTIDDIGIRKGFRASLAIRIFLDSQGKVDRIKFRIDYL